MAQQLRIHRLANERVWVRLQCSEEEQVVPHLNEHVAVYGPGRVLDRLAGQRDHRTDTGRGDETFMTKETRSVSITVRRHQLRVQKDGIAGSWDED